MLLPTNAGHFSLTSFHLYEGARRVPQWNPKTDIDWNRRTILPEHQHELVWWMASQGCYAEQTGLVMASKLLAEADDLPARLCLATAVSDEAKHAEVFARYALLLGNAISPPDTYVNEMFNSLNGISDFISLFLVHTLLEGLAADEFRLLIRAFEGDLFGTIHEYVLRDEARHVAMGLDYLAPRVTAAVHDGWDLAKFEQQALTVSGVANSPFTTLASLTGDHPDNLRNWFLTRHKARMKRISTERR
jgi:hypothetical protein